MTAYSPPHRADGAVAWLARLVEELQQGIPSGRFLSLLAQHASTATGAAGVVVWTVDDGVPTIAAQEGLDELKGEDVLANLRQSELHRDVISQVAAAGNSAIVPPGANGDRQAHNPTAFALLLAPVLVHRRVACVVELFQHPGDEPERQREQLALLMRFAGVAADYLRDDRLRESQGKAALWQRVEQFAAAVHESLDRRLTTYAIANEARKLLDCDRVSVAVVHGAKCRIEAVSGQDTVERRSNVIRLMERLATAVAKTKETLWSEADELPPQLERPLDSYVEESFAKSLAVIPLFRPGRPAPDPPNEHRDQSAVGEVNGVLIAEQLEGVFERAVIEPKAELIVRHAARSLSQSLEHDRLFLMPLWKALGKTSGLFRARALPKTLAVLCAVVLVALALALIPAPFDLEARGKLQPSVMREVFVAEDGVIIDVRVSNLSEVEAGDVLLVIHNPDLEVQLAELYGRREAAYRQLRSAWITHRDALNLSKDERADLITERLQLQQRIANLDEQIALLEQRKARLTVTSPIDGQVVTWDAEDELLGRPVKPGDLVLTVIDPDSEWEVELYMPETRMGHLNRAADNLDVGEPLDVTFILATDPSRSLSGKVKSVHDAAELDEQEGNAVKIRVGDIDKEQLGEPRAGATVIADVHCGYRPVGYVWFHEAYEWAQKTIFYYF